MRRVLTLLLLISTAAICWSQSLVTNQPLVLPPSTPLTLRTDVTVHMRIGTPIKAHLLYPVYADNELLLPAGTEVHGEVVSLRSNHSRRIAARLNGDFTPFHVPTVRFTRIVLNGVNIPLDTNTATDGALIYRIVAPPAGSGGFIHRQISTEIQSLREQVQIFTAPGKVDRLTQFVYSQIPWHPERIEAGTTWILETASPLTLAATTAPPATETIAIHKPAKSKPTKPGAPPDHPNTWMLEAYLTSPLTSANAKTGDEVRATVAEPIFNDDHTIAVPQGAVLLGAVTQAKPSRTFGRSAKLSFDFKQIVMPTGEAHAVQTALTGVDSESASALALSSEGAVQPRAKDKIAVPLLLGALAGNTLDEDRHNHGHLGTNAAGSNAFGLVGRIIGTFSSQKVAAGIGYYATAISTWKRWVARGPQVTFPKDTRIVLQTTARRSAALKPVVEQ